MGGLSDQPDDHMGPKRCGSAPSEAKVRSARGCSKQIKNYYADMAAMQFEISGSEVVQAVAQRRELFRKTEAQSDALIDALETVLP